ncbi:hypothetical protein GQ44DRAFT_758625 [Phaeosphaeriaceae sp. PMI808]|nr:hypothetical protein GQ44DRAFT_758625 [Phaeosphaeriaceae sp. PMI808]
MSSYCSCQNCQHQQQHQSQPQLQSQLLAETEPFNYDSNYAFYPHIYYQETYPPQGYIPNDTAQGLGYQQTTVTSHGEPAAQLIPDATATAPKEEVTLSRLEDLLENIRREINERNRAYREVEEYMKKLVAWTEEVQALAEGLKRQVRVKPKSPEHETHELS